MKTKNLIYPLALFMAAVTVIGLSSFKPKGKTEGFINFSTKNDKHPVSGSFEKWRINNFSIEKNKIETVEATIEVETSSIKVESQKLNDHLKAEDFLSVVAFPNATITVDGAKLEAEGKYSTIATIDLKGISDKIELSFEVVSKKPLKIKGTGVLNRNNHNVGQPNGHYGLIPEVTITFETTLN